MGDPKKPSSWTVAKEVAKATVGIGDMPSDAEMVAQEEADAVNSPDKVRERARRGEPGLVAPDGTAKSADASPARAEAFLPGVVGDTSADDELRRVQSVTQNVERPLVNSAGPAQHIRPEGFSTASGGGDDIYNTTFENAPQRSMEAKADLADLSGKRSDALTGFYNEQSQRDVQAAAASKQYASEDQQNLAARQRKLDEATQYYTNDLQDQGKFWQNPGNIVSAIAFSLMPIFSNDPAVGVKLINQAIDRDMANRQHAANQTLGALRSNLDGYHKIAGDRQAGDLLAQAEAHRIAAQQIQQISMSFESPIAKKQAQMAIADQLTRQKGAQMEYNKSIHKDAQVMDPRMEAAQVQGVNGFRRGAVGVPLGGAPPATDTDARPQGAISGTIGDKGVIPTTAAPVKVSPTATALAKAGGPRAVATGVARGLVKPDDAEEAMRQFYVDEAVSIGKRTPEQINGHWYEAKKKAHDEVGSVADKMHDDVRASSMVTRLQNRMNLIEALATKNAKDPNEFVPWAIKSGFMPQSLETQYRVVAGGDPRREANAAGELEKWRQRAVAQFQQEMAANINQHRHDLSGGAVSDSENTALRQEINPQMPWQEQKNWLDMRSRGVQASIEATALRLGSPLAQVEYRQRTRNVGQQALATRGIAAHPKDNNSSSRVAARDALGIGNKGVLPNADASDVEGK